MTKGEDVTREKRIGGLARAARGIATVALAVALGCAAAKQLAAMRQVEFHLNGVSGARLAGVTLDNIRSYSDLKPADVPVLNKVKPSVETATSSTRSSKSSTKTRRNKHKQFVGGRLR